MRTFRNLIPATLGCVLAAAGAFGAESPAALNGTSVTVRYGDLDLSRSEGTVALYGRLQGAARTVCGTRDSRDLTAYVGSKKCYMRTLSKAVETVDQPSLLALHRARTSA